MNLQTVKKRTAALLFLFFLSGICVIQMRICITFGRVMNLKGDAGTSACFRKQQLSEETLKRLHEVSQETGVSKGALLSVWMPMEHFCPVDGGELTAESYVKWDAYFSKYRKKEYAKLQVLYQAVWDDVVYFPTGEGMTYEDSWMFERNYGGKRRHEGCDLMPPENQSGRYPIFSMTDGIVEKVGWLEKGGFRLGIRSPHGGYFYYAHLSDYAMDFQIGQKVQAGDLIGYMGDTGYGPEGTRGMFDVHLHLGVYVRTEENPEISVNPYWILKSLEGQILKYRY